VNISIETKGLTGAASVTEALRQIGRQAPFAMVKTLNAVANEAQTSIRKGMNQFTFRRRSFVEKTIYRDKATDFATKTHLSATVRVNPGRDFLAQHEDGGQKTPLSGRSVAIPLPAVQEAAGNAVIPKRLRPSGLLTNGQVRKVVTASGTYLVRNRPGRGRGGLSGWRTEFLYKLKPSVPIRPRLNFHTNAAKAIDASFERIAMAQIEAILV
jgi:hypothetical protein